MWTNRSKKLIETGVAKQERKEGEFSKQSSPSSSPISVTLISSELRSSSCSMPMDQAELTTEQVLKRDISWETYMTTKLITGTGLQLLRRYDNRSESYRAALLDDQTQKEPDYSIIGLLQMKILMNPS
ncbi:hypothetical protein F0562_029715 [Nyssa sinensis]|uniref:Uncharacterized protein n=1 Tax=Nyssa sinensis TaxID=561372 RepID=A0A5J5B3F1_9ASTE|nr:hypothetical protein F0562_029715 [Nyssa sinensis]